MTKAAAFQATVHGFRTVPSRGVVSITIEAPIEHHAEIARIAEHGTWVAVARLKEPKEVMPDTELKSTFETIPAQDDQERPARGKREWRDMPPSQQAAIRCGEPVFWAFLREKYTYKPASADDAAEAVRDLCVVPSRKDLNSNHQARAIWFAVDSAFQAWKAVEHA